MGHSHSLDHLGVLMLSVSPWNELELMKGCQRNRKVIMDSTFAHYIATISCILKYLPILPLRCASELHILLHFNCHESVLTHL